MSARPVQTSARTPEQIEADAQWERYLAERANAAREAARIAPRVVVILVVALALVLALVLANRAHAQETNANGNTSASWHLVLHGLSVHGSAHRYDNGAPYNERNWGAGLRWQATNTLDGQLGAYRNSYDRISVYGVGTWLPLELGSLRAGAFAGVTNHYPMHDGRAIAVGGLAVRLQGDTYSATVRAVPAVAGKTHGCITLELGVQL